MRWEIKALILGLSDCTFSPSGIGGSDAGPTVNVGFQSATSLQDEASATFEIPVVLSGSASAPIVVQYEITGGTATRDVDSELFPGRRSVHAPCARTR
jgi:hypothetical protein